MAKDKKTKDPDPVATALTAPDAPADIAVETAPDGAAASVVPPAGPPERLAAPRRPAPVPAPANTPATNPVLHPGDAAVAAVSEVARVVRTVLPNRAPAYLGGAALLVLGVVDLPVVAGGALAYEALRRWGPAPARSTH
ncbi:hypothetical protein [Actinomycetospora cinnamomea]|nr:hypothetical protein [Actinomycetospora cinnamomea]